MGAVQSPVFCCLVLSTTVILLQDAAIASQAPIDLKLAHQHFHEAQTLSEKDAGRLWGTSLYGPMLFVDPKTRTVVANQADRHGHLKKRGDVFVGTLPAQETIANTAMSWAGVEWTMLVWPLPKDRHERLRLMAHELWHRVQGELGLSGSDPANSHLDTREGRIWLQLEWRALQAALRHRGIKRQRAIEDALTFRAYRRSLFPEHSRAERALEMGEGLAEYTGVRLSGDSEAAVVARAVKDLKDAESVETFVRSFAYASGPAYGILLDGAGSDWRKGLGADDDLGRLLQEAVSISLPPDLGSEVQGRATAYDADRLIAAETERDNTRRRRLAEYRKRFVDGPVLIIPLRQMNIEFDPRNLHPLDDLGTVYPTMTLTDAWGILTVAKDALLNKNWSKVRVTAPEDTTARPVKGDGWTLELKDGWELRAGERKGDYVVRRVRNDR